MLVLSIFIHLIMNIYDAKRKPVKIKREEFRKYRIKF